MTPSEFNEAVWQFYAEHGRHDLPWRRREPDGTFDPYKITVSELMLQQTQVSRVIPKFHEFLMRFPDVQSLATASLADVLKLWSGLGYNRRAKFLWQTAQRVTERHAGVFPDSVQQLVALPGIGINTAGAIVTYAFNQPVIFIETNIRTVYIHHFFHHQTTVDDSLIRELLQQTLDREQSREFYWALMDYGSFLKRSVGNLSKFSTTYNKQSRFEGSRRQVRGQVLKQLAQQSATFDELRQQITDDRLPAVLQTMVDEGMIRLRADCYRL